MASFESSLSFRGLVTSPNHLGAGSEGALVVADNVTLRYPDVLEPRKGVQETPEGAAVDKAVAQVTFFDGEVVTFTQDGEIHVGEGAALTGTYLPADPNFRMKTVATGGSLYAATDEGVIAIDSTSTTVPRLAGIKEPLRPDASVLPDSTAPAPTIEGFLAVDKAVAYRVLFGYKDDEGIINLGPASTRIIAKNVGYGARASVSLTVSLLTAPTDVNGDLLPGLFIRAYRSPVVDATEPPLDILNLATEIAVDTANLTTTDTVELVDVASPEFVLAQAALYSNEEQGELPNEPPPFTHADVTSWNDRTWYANTNLPDLLGVQLIGVEGGGGGTDLPATGLRVGDTLTFVDGATTTVFTGIAGFTKPATREFQVYSAGDPTENINETLGELADCINGYAALTSTWNIVAYLRVGAFQEVTSNIVFQRNAIDAASSVGFTVEYDVPLLTCTVAAKVLGVQTVTTTTDHQFVEGDVVRFRSAVSPALPRIDAVVTTVVSSTQVRVTPVTVDVPTGYTKVSRRYVETVWNPDLSVAQSSDNDHQVNRLFYSKIQEPEAVPLLNFLNVGRNGNPIRRIVPQRDRLLVFKDEGTYAVYGDYPFSVSLVDDTVQIVAPDSVAAVGSTVFALMDDGVVGITEGSIQPVSDAIEFTLMPYLSENGRAATAGAFGVAYESQKLYALFLPDLSGTYGSGYAAKAYVLGMRSQPMAWTTWTFAQPMTCGKVDPVTDAGYYGTGNTGLTCLLRDRNTSTLLDYKDLTTTGEQAIACTVQWASTTLGSPYATKQMREVHAHFRDARQQVGGTATMRWSVKTDIVPDETDVIPMWPDGQAPTATSNVIGPTTLPLQFRKLVPQAVQRAAYYTLGFTSSVKNAYWALNGYTLAFEATSERTGTVR